MSSTKEFHELWLFFCEWTTFNMRYFLLNDSATQEKGGPFSAIENAASLKLFSNKSWSTEAVVDGQWAWPSVLFYWTFEKCFENGICVTMYNRFHTKSFFCHLNSGKKFIQSVRSKRISFTLSFLRNTYSLNFRLPRKIMVVSCYSHIYVKRDSSRIDSIYLVERWQLHIEITMVGISTSFFNHVSILQNTK